MQEVGVVNVDVRKGTTRLDSHVGLQEAFGELKLHDIGPEFRFHFRTRGHSGISTATFAAFSSWKNSRACVFFGNLDSNRWQYNVAYFNFLEKNTNSGLNSMALRNQQVIIANAYRQDFLFPGIYSAVERALQQG